MPWRGLNAGSCTPLPRLVCPQPRLSSRHLRERRFYQAGRLDRPRRPPSVQSRFAQFGCYLRWGDVIRLLRGHCSSVFAHTGSCAAPVGLSPPSAFGLVWRVPAAHGSFPTLSTENRSLDAGPHTPAVLRVLAPVSSTAPSAFPRSRVGSASRVCPRITISRGVAFRGCRYFVMFRPPSLLAPQIVPTAANTAAGQPGLLRPSRTRFVASPRIGYANRPNTGNWRYGDLHPARLSALSAAPSTMPRFQSPPRRTQHADFPLYAHLPASPQELWDLSCWGDFRLQSLHHVAVEQLQG